MLIRPRISNQCGQQCEVILIKESYADICSPVHLQQPWQQNMEKTQQPMRFCTELVKFYIAQSFPLSHSKRSKSASSKLLNLFKSPCPCPCQPCQPSQVPQPKSGGDPVYVNHVTRDSVCFTSVSSSFQSFLITRWRGSTPNWRQQCTQMHLSSSLRLKTCW